MKKADEVLNRRLAELDDRRQRDRQEADIKYPARLAELRQRRDEGIATGRGALSAPHQGAR